ncbi:uncharacterized protein BXZ73DRAFT_91884 [Epithele typhae]|uniref:uncharacterized protein n=1 Tax=Epithele typhae TaxID=378194 RepID=UPI0020073D9D|nr:uncharacterized protein BXZ73DRAFT_91884 [Epithele typhae]KAH9920869.1 hypothetical protein BXZ73DRAFT_91884 [Epithele typhae]
MSRRSYAGSMHERRASRLRVTEDELVNLLSYRISPKAVEAAQAVQKQEQERERDYSARITNAVSNSIFSLGDLFRDGQKGVRFPKDLIKVVEQKLQDIAMGKDAAYSDQLTRRIMAIFYGQVKDETFRRQLKENRKIEELILVFATQATNVLKKEPSLAGDAWKVELNNHIAQFVRLLRDCLRNVSHQSSDSGYDSASTSNRESFSSAAKQISMSVNDMPLVKTAAKLFKLTTSVTQKEIDDLAKFCSEKTCLKNINAGAAFPLRREDFESDSAYQYWRTLETSHLSQLMVVMMQFNPELAKSTPAESLSSTERPGSIYSASSSGGRPGSYYDGGARIRHPSIASRNSIASLGGVGPSDPDLGALEGDEEIQVGFHFTSFPRTPANTTSVFSSTASPRTSKHAEPAVGDDDEVSLGILSAHHIELINEVALRWRIGQPYRVACFLDICVPEALNNIARLVAEVELDKWPKQDHFLSHLYHSLDGLPAIKASEIQPYLSILEIVGDRQLCREVSARYYGNKLHELQSEPGVNRALPLLLMTDEIEKNAKLLDKGSQTRCSGKPSMPLMSQHAELTSLQANRYRLAHAEIQIPHFLMDLDDSKKRLFEDSMNGPTPDVPIQDIFALYRRTKILLGMYGAFCPQGDIQFNVGMFFEPYVRQWLLNTDDKTTQWVQAFEAEGEEGHSSSIIDLFDSLRSPIQFLQDLEWVDEYQEARFFTSLSKTISKAINQYCTTVEEMFMTEMFPRNDYLQPQKSSAWIEKAKQLTDRTEKKIETFTFQPESCVKLNNIEAARRLLDSMYEQIEADKKMDILEHTAPPTPEKVDRKDRFLFTVKVSMAEGLVPLDSSPSARLDTFVTLSDEQGNRLAKTRTIYETLNPRWDESFDVSRADRALVGKHDTVGRAYLCLDPKRFADFMAHELWFDLDSQGRILLRVSMEGEKDDLQFYFGRAFRSLKRGENDMVRVFIDKMTPFIHYSLSRSVLKSLVKSTAQGSIDYNKAFGNVTALFGSALGSKDEVQIPLPQSEKPRFKPEGLTDVEIEQAIVPLFNFFDENLSTLNTYLSETTKDMVLGRVWKDILKVIEGLLIPPLSEAQSDMKPLTDKEVDIVFKWLRFLRDYFHAGGEGPISLEALQNQKYRDILSIRLYYDWHTDALMEECVRMMQHSLRSAPSIKKRAKSNRKKEKQQEKEKDVSNGETILRILRMRPNTSDFIAQQRQAMISLQAERDAAAKQKENRKLQRPRQQQDSGIPPVPEVPPLPPKGE